jgi:DNA-directed RNA polymerase subunit M/transcription elongation factor TFIIS
MSSRTQILKGIRSKSQSRSKSTRKKKETKKKIIVFEEDENNEAVNIDNDYIKQTLNELDDDKLKKLDFNQLYELVNLKSRDFNLYDQYIMLINNDNNIDINDIIWDNPLLKDYKANNINFLNLYNFRQEHVEGVYTCKCKNTKVILEQKQIRGGDEGMTTIIKCVKCSNIWREN